MDDVTNIFLCFLITKKQVDSMLSRVCSIIDHSRGEIVARTSVKNLDIALCVTF